MAYYPNLDSIVAANLPDNSTQYITAARHRLTMAQAKDLGAPQVFGAVDTTFDPGTPQNPTTYLTFRGVYQNFPDINSDPCEITAPIGFLKYLGSYWEAINVPIASPYEYRQCVTTQARSLGVAYTSVNVAMSNGGWEAKAGTWVQLVNHRTGEYDFVQLTADLEDDDTSITFKSRVLQCALPVGSIVEINPQINMEWTGITVGANGIDNYITVPDDWRLPPIQTINSERWTSIIDIRIDGKECYWAAVPNDPFEFRMDADFPLRIYFGSVIDSLTRVSVRYLQPRIRTISA